jgi:hypothetical protein
MIKSIVNDIYHDENEDGTLYHIITIDLEIWDKDTLEYTLDIDLNLELMGIDVNSDFDYTISREICNYTDNYMKEKNDIPTIKEIQEHMESTKYLTLEVNK